MKGTQPVPFIYDIDWTPGSQRAAANADYDLRHTLINATILLIYDVDRTLGPLRIYALIQPVSA